MIDINHVHDVDLTGAVMIVGATGDARPDPALELALVARGEIELGGDGQFDLESRLSPNSTLVISEALRPI